MGTRSAAPYNPHGNTTASEQGRDRAIARNTARRLNGTPSDDRPNLVVIRNPNAPASDAQKNLMDILIRDLARLDADKAHQADTWSRAVIEKGEMTKDLASRTITRLRERIAEARESTPVGQQTQEVHARAATFVDKFTDVPDGYYAIDSPTSGQDLSFYRVTTWKDSSNRKVQIQAGPNWHPVSRGMRDGILLRIREAGYKDAARRYAKEIGRCHRCNLQLTDETSRAIGMGSTCAGKNAGW